MKWLQSTVVSANMFHRKPEVPPLFYPLYKMLKRFNDLLTINCKLIPMYVLDGAREKIKGPICWKIKRDLDKYIVMTTLIKAITMVTMVYIFNYNLHCIGIANCIR